ncbi:sensor histidine kinase [Kineococcus sp. SYSU DK003]|uniref:sensor histidine kinase n=1 Tax=Kineococcus sp. SYSU DK003 TaxID=3383124 RepID=UPI003D7D4081
MTSGFDERTRWDGPRGGVDGGSDGDPDGGPDDPGITFPQVGRLELDQLLEQLIERAQDVLSTQGRLRSLLAATRAISTDLDLPVLLRRTAVAARDLVGARYAVLAVPGPGGESGPGWQEYRAGDAVAEPAAGTSRLEVPVRVRGEFFGNLHVSGKIVGGTVVPFSSEDSELLVALASAAGVAIDNARLFDVAERRQRWLQASAEIVRDLLAERSSPLSLIARQARAAALADLGLVLRVDHGDEELLQVVAADGEVADLLLGTTWRRVETLAGRVLGQEADAVFTDAAQAGMNTSLTAVPSGPAMMVHVPLTPGQRPALLVLLRRTGARAFGDDDLAMAGDFTGHVALALELGRAQEDRRRLALVDDRDRIARDLHDHVIQQLFASGLRLSALAGRTAEPETARALRQVVEACDETIRAIRSTIFQLTHAPREVDVRDVVLPLVAEFTDLLGFPPTVAFDVPAGALVTGDVAGHVEAVVRELLSNCARHARAGHVTVQVELSPHELVLTVADDGVGTGPAAGTGTAHRRSGLANLEQRARSLGGSCTTTSPTHTSPGGGGRGTRTRWSVPGRSALCGR